MPKCECQRDEHFGPKPVPKTRRHAYAASFPAAELAPSGKNETTGHVFMHCRACRQSHTNAALLTELLREIGRTP